MPRLERMPRADLVALVTSERRACGDALRSVHELEIKLLDLRAQNEQLRETLLEAESELFVSRIPAPLSERRVHAIGAR